MNASTDQRKPDQPPPPPRPPIAETNAPGQWHPKQPKPPSDAARRKQPADYFLG